MAVQLPPRARAPGGRGRGERAGRGELVVRAGAPRLPQHPAVDRERGAGLAVARVGGDDGGPGEVVPPGHSVEQRARGGEAARGAAERRDEGVVGAYIGAWEGGEEGERVRESGRVRGEEVEDAVGEERGGRPE